MNTTKRVVCFLSLWLLLGQVRGSHIPSKMNRTIQNLTQQHYRIDPLVRFDGKPVFTNEEWPGKTEFKKVFMGGILDTYDQMLNKMLEQLPTPSPGTSGDPGANAKAALKASSGDDNVREQLNYLLNMVHKLKRNGYEDQERLLKRLELLHDIKTDNFVVQSKALYELSRLYGEASSLVTDRRRRRRQTHRNKKRVQVTKS